LSEMEHNLSDNYVGNALDMYRRVLSDQDDNSVTIISVGFLNNLYDLLIAEPDLVAKKVKQLVLMGGNANDDFNFVRHDTIDQAQYLLENWPGHIMISQEGAAIHTGSNLEYTSVENPVRAAYYWWNRRSWENTDNFRARSSWDQMAVLYGVRGDEGNFFVMNNKAGILKNGYMWRMSPGFRELLVNARSNQEYADLIETLMTKYPGHQ